MVGFRKRLVIKVLSLVQAQRTEKSSLARCAMIKKTPFFFPCLLSLACRCEQGSGVA